MPHKLPSGLYALIDDAVRPEVSVVDKARAVVAAGVGVLQLRLETTTDRHALAIIREVMGLVGSTLVIINDRVDLALAGEAHGVHLGEDDLPIDVARRMLGPGRLIGATTRSLEDIVRAYALGADHVGLGPIFPTRTKVVKHDPLGIEAFERIVKRSPLPVVGIAGITLHTIGAVARAGAWGAAAAGGLLEHGDIAAQACALAGAFLASSRYQEHGAQ
jgi:thiamine-phosphate pyrophosphorylase